MDLTTAIAIVSFAYMRDGVVDAIGLASPAECVAYARDTLTLPGTHAIGAYPIEDMGDIESAAFIAVVSASDDAIRATL